MNWLAHLYLSEADPAFRIGNLLPDMLPPDAIAALTGQFQRGAEQHRKIDAFTDSHPVFRRSVRRLSPAFRRFGAILFDVFYDHFLARTWSAYSTQPLPDFVDAVHRSFDVHRAEIPPLAYERLCDMRSGNWLQTYGDLDGLRNTLHRIERRFRRPVDLASSVAELELHYSDCKADFDEFFPELVERFGGNNSATACPADTASSGYKDPCGFAAGFGTLPSPERLS